MRGASVCIRCTFNVLVQPQNSNDKKLVPVMQTELCQGNKYKCTLQFNRIIKCVLIYCTTQVSLKSSTTYLITLVGKMIDTYSYVILRDMIIKFLLPLLIIL